MEVGQRIYDLHKGMYRAVASGPAGPFLAGPLFVAELVPRRRTLVPSMHHRRDGPSTKVATMRVRQPCRPFRYRDLSHSPEVSLRALPSASDYCTVVHSSIVLQSTSDTNFAPT